MPGDDNVAVCPVEKDFATPLALDEAVDLALCNDPQIQTAWANIKVEAGALGEAKAAYLPTVTGSFSRIKDRTSHPDSVFPGTTVISNTLFGAFSWRLFDFGTRSANREAAEKLLAAALASHDAALQKSLSSVIEAYFDVYTARAAFFAKTQSEEIASNTLIAAKKREAKGASALSDTLQAATALAKATLEKSRAQGDYQKSLSVLVYSLGVPGTTQIILPDSIDESTDHDDRDLSDWLEHAQKSHPAILAAHAEVEAAQKKVEATRSDGLPTLDLTGNYYDNGRPGQPLTIDKTHESTIGLVVTVPIFEGFARTYKIRGAEAQVEVKEAGLADTEHQIMMEVVKAYADATSALQNLQASEDLLKSAQNALGVSQRKYDKGAADILELLNTQSALADAKQERIRALAEWRAARLKLLASAGLMGRYAVEK
ncbi:MAG TPA: TolC family protein [Methylophilaceae bacterium]